MSRKQKKNLTRIIISAVLYIAARLTEEYSVVSTVLYVASYVIVGYDILKKAVKGVINHQVFDENFLMATASLGSIYLGELSEAVMVMLLYQIGEFFQSYAVGKSRENIVKLMDIRPDYANIEKDGELIRIDPQEVEVGTIITVMPSEKIPIDGIVVDGEALLNTSALTGESLPVEVRVNSEVISGCIDMNAVLKIKTTQLFSQSTASRILELVENASSNKSKSEDFISKFAKVYTPFVCGCALVLATVVPLVIRAITGSVVWSDWVYRALTFLVISCPCAFVISIPLTFFAAIGGASRKGILIKGSNYLETLSKIRTIAFDKTGTITRGVFEVVAVHGEIEE
ncbi:MAG: HAD-IC family P-type ATPase, partial [Erysipelotrichaceae bacterium]|nr:HAD-IC family P-type ATPase [Erysipelotrichaceae bacterium]